MTSPSILIVDDNPQNLQVLAKILQENKYEIEYATNGEAALKWLKDKKFALVLLDINMPGMNGFEVCKGIRSDTRMNKTPVIFLTADTDRKSILKGFDYGAQDYVTKPFDGRELLARVRTHISLQDSLEKLENINTLLEIKVTERTQQLNEANNKLESTNKKLLVLDRAKTDFLRLISHEIRTPLTGILGPINILKDRVDLSVLSDFIEILDASVKRLERFSLDALLITQLKTKNLEIKRDKIQLNKLLIELTEEENESLKSKNLQVKLIDSSSGTIIYGDNPLIKKCVLSILENAIVQSPPNSVITIHNYIEGKTIVCEIIDKGKGFDPVFMDNSPELFITVGEYRDNHIGIGLPIASMIMEGHGGRIIIGNNPDSGATVKLVFPN